jgi:hypothetical protein
MKDKKESTSTIDTSKYLPVFYNTYQSSNFEGVVSNIILVKKIRRGIYGLLFIKVTYAS